MALYTRSQAAAAAAAAAAEPFQRSDHDIQLLFKKDDWQENALNPPFNNFDALLSYQVALRGLGEEMAIFRMNTGYFSKLFIMLSLDTQPRQRFLSVNN